MVMMKRQQQLYESKGIWVIKNELLGWCRWHYGDVSFAYILMARKNGDESRVG